MGDIAPGDRVLVRTWDGREWVAATVVHAPSADGWCVVEIRDGEIFELTTRREREIVRAGAVRRALARPWLEAVRELWKEPVAVALAAALGWLAAWALDSLP